MKIVIKKGGLIWKKFHFRAVADNGRILFRSRKEATVEDCLVTLNRIKKFCKTGIGLRFDIDTNWRLKQKHHFRIFGTDPEDYEILGWSENYYNRKDVEDTERLIRDGIGEAKLVMNL